MPILQAIEVTGQTAGNAVLEKAMADVVESVKQGGQIATPLRDEPIFPPMVAQMIAVGEETGGLDHMLTKVADFYEDEVAAAIKALTSILEPVMIVLVGGIVGFIVIAMYMPMFKVYDTDQVTPTRCTSREAPHEGRFVVSGEHQDLAVAQIATGAPRRDPVLARLDREARARPSGRAPAAGTSISTATSSPGPASAIAKPTSHRGGRSTVESGRLA